MPHAQAQSDDSKYSPPLREAIAAYRAGDLDTAEKTLRSYAAGDADAEAWLGVVLIDRGRNADAMKALQHAANAGSSEANHRLGLVFAEGLAGTPRNDQRGAEYFEKAANAGHRRAQINLGILYLRGQGVTRDLVQARAWLEKAAATEDPAALYTLGRAMEERDETIAADSIRAADLYRRAAQKGHALASLRYGLAMVDGIGVKRDPNGAQAWLLQANDSGVPEAALALGDLSARTPASRDKEANARIVERAVGWYEVAARAGVPSAQFKLANAYFAGAGIARDPVQALAWYGRAAQQGLPEAENAFGVMLLGGVAGTPDAVEGYEWLLLAEAGGYPDSRAVREKTKGQISPRDVAQAERLAKAFKPVLERPIDDVVQRLVTPLARPPPSRDRGRRVRAPSPPGASRHHPRRLPRRLSRDAPGRPFRAAGGAPARRPARRHLRRGTRRQPHHRRDQVLDRGLARRREMAGLFQLVRSVLRRGTHRLSAGAHSRGDWPDRGRRLRRRDSAPSAAPPDRRGAPQVAADRLRAARVRTSGATGRPRLRRDCRLRFKTVNVLSSGRGFPTARRRALPRPCGYGRRP